MKKISSSVGLHQQLQTLTGTNGHDNPATNAIACFLRSPLTSYLAKWWELKSSPSTLTSYITLIFPRAHLSAYSTEFLGT